MSDTPGQPGPSSQPQPQAGPSKAASSWKPQYSETGPGPSLQTYRRHPERAYGGPNPDSSSNARTPEQAEQYWKRVRAVEGPPSPRFGRSMGIGGWVLSGVAVFYMVAYADFGDKEHVFSEPRRQWHKFTNNMFTSSEKERNMMGSEKPLKSQAQAQEKV